LDFTKRAASYLNPIGTVFNEAGTGVAGFFNNLTKIGTLPRENKDLQDKLDRAMTEIARLSAAQKENEELRANLNFKKTTNLTLVGANVVFFDPNNIRETITIDVGKNDGLKKGDVVLARGFLVGKIREITDRTARVILITDPDSAIPAQISELNITGIAKGKIGSGLILDQVPQSEKVDTVQQISGSIFQAIEIRPMVDLSQLEKVMVVRG
jgi:rod shape-determining protein MreC